MTILQQLVLFFLALVGLALAFKLLVKLRLLPLLLWWVIGKVIFSQWFAGHPVVFYGVLGILALLTLASWLGPLLGRIQENKRAERMVLEELSRARAEGRTIDYIQVENGIPVAKYKA